MDPTTGALTDVSTGTLNNFITYELIVGDPHNNVIYAMGENNNSASQQTGLSSFLMQSDGNLQQIGPTIYPGSPSEGALALDPQGHFSYDYDITTGGGVYIYPIKSDGTLGTAVTGPAFNVGKAMTFSSPSDPNACVYAGVDTTIVAHPNGKFLYVSCTAGHQATQRAVSSTGTIAVKGSIPLSAKNDVLSSLAMDRAGKYLFGTEENQNQVLVFSVNATTGQLTLASTTAAGTRPNSVAAGPNGTYLYLTNGFSNICKNDYYPGSDNLSFYSISSIGDLTPVSGSPVATGRGPRGVIAVKP